MCDSFSRIHMTFPDLKTRDFTAEGMSECGKEAVTISAVVAGVDKVAANSDNAKHVRLSPLCEYLQRRN
jgi:hypothetical protein